MKRVLAAAVVLVVAALLLIALLPSGGPVAVVPSPTPSLVEPATELPPRLVLIKPSPGASAPPASGAASFSLPFSWPRMSRRDFGCLLERAGARDRMWNCDSPPEPDENPCGDSENYFRGPQLAPESASRISPLVESVEFHWEHRQLQQIDFRMKPGTDERAIREAFALPGTLRVPFENVQSVEITDCGGGARCLVVRGFERGDVDCGDGRRPD